MIGIQKLNLDQCLLKMPEQAFNLLGACCFTLKTDTHGFALLTHCSDTTFIRQDLYCLSQVERSIFGIHGNTDQGIASFNLFIGQSKTLIAKDQRAAQAAIGM